MTHPTIAGTRVIDPLTPDSRLLVRWFVQYNPLFTLSALCVLGGVLLLGRAIDGTSSAALTLTAIVELYQWLVIVVAGLLYGRLNEHRPGVILGLIAVVFLVDPTLQVSALVTASHPLIAAAWVGLVALKVQGLSWAMCVRLSPSARALPPLAAAVVVCVTQMRLADDVALHTPVALAVGVCALSALAAVLRPTMTSTRALGEVGQVMFPRLTRAVVAIGVAGVLLQGSNALLALGGQAALAVAGAGLLAVVMHARSEGHVWPALVAACFLLGPVVPLHFVALPLASFALCVASRHHAARVLAVGLFTAALPTFAVGGFGAPTADMALIGVVTAALVALTWLRRAPSAAILAVGLHVRTAATFLPAALTHAKAVGHFGWGAALVVAGFVALPLGVVAHRRLSRLIDDAPLPLATDGDAPATSAAPLSL